MRLPFHRTKYDLFLLAFFLSAGLSVFFAYNQGQAVHKLLLFFIAILLFYILAGQTQKRVWLIAGGLSLLGAGMAVYFLLTNDWQQYPAKIGFINQVGLWWMSVRPKFFIGGIYHNSAAGVIALAFPFTIAAILDSWRQNRFLPAILSCVMAGLSAVGFLLTTSRGAALALFYGLVIWILVYLLDRMQNRFTVRWLKCARYLVIPLLIVAAGLSFLWLAGPVSFSSEQAVFTNSGSRLELYGNSLKLIQDFPLVGAGLSSFPGIYSNYILDIPNFFFQTSHNLYLNVAIEQGVIGALALCALYLGSLASFLKLDSTKGSIFAGAALASLVIIVLHNLVDTVIGETTLAPLIFLIPGYAWMILHPAQLVPPLALQSPFPSSEHGRENETPPPILLTLEGKEAGDEGKPAQSRIPHLSSKSITLLIVALLAILSFAFFRPALSAIYANLGAAQMAKVELGGFPTNQWDKGEHLAELAPAEALFLQALAYDPSNRTANHRLGLIAMMRRNFPAAIASLETACQADPDHRGIQKALGYAYTWAGQLNQALPLLRKIPEARQELQTYQWWWADQNRPDLAEYAARMVERLGE